MTAGIRIYELFKINVLILVVNLHDKNNEKYINNNKISTSENKVRGTFIIFINLPLIKRMKEKILVSIKNKEQRIRRFTTILAQGAFFDMQSSITFDFSLIFTVLIRDKHFNLLYTHSVTKSLTTITQKMSATIDNQVASQSQVQSAIS
jgi:hypothetical protein